MILRCQQEEQNCGILKNQSMINAQKGSNSVDGTPLGGYSIMQLPDVPDDAI